MKSVMTPQQLFNKVSKPSIERSTFDRSHGYKTTFDAGLLIPIFVDEALPGDTFNLKTSLFGRLATPLKPVMDNIALDIHYFSVPIRLVWDNFQKFMGEQINPGDSTSYIMPTATAPVGGYLEQSPQDYLGLPTKVAGYDHRNDFLRAMHLIYNEWYRDENLQDSVVVDTDDGPDTVTDYQTLLPRGKRKDYFTSALPWAQKADPVTIPLGTTAPINRVSGAGEWDVYAENTDNKILFAGALQSTALSSAQHAVTGDLVSLDPNGGLETDLSAASAQTINQLREAFQIQKMYERDARGGTRYTEMNYAHFGVISPDQRLQRPEYLGGGTSYINVSPIAQQSETTTGTPQGNLAAMGTVSSNGKGFIKSFTEHELILGFVSVRADITYQQGLNRMWSRSTRFDHYFPAFAHLGEQTILNKEIYTQGLIADADVFGYQERYAEYRYKPSQVTGLFRSNATASLDVWHLSQDFTSLPSLNETFIVENPPIERIVAVTSEPEFILDAYFDLKCTRPMPTFAIPGKIDHF